MLRHWIKYYQKKPLCLHQVNNTLISIETLFQGNKLTGIHLEGNLINGS